MEQKEKIIEAIKIVGSRLNKQNIKWLVGGSGSLLVHGLEVIPNDIDIAVNQENYEEAKTILKDIIAGKTETIEDTKKTPFKVNNIEGDLLAFDIDDSLLTTVNIDGVTVFAHRLEVEYEFYKARTDKLEANRKKVELIEKALSAKL